MRGNPFYFGGFTGGLNTRDSAYDVEQNQARDLSNMLGTNTGAMRKREGNVTFATPASPLQSIFPFENGATPYLVAQGYSAGAGSAWYRIAADGSVTTITGTSTPTANLPWSAVQAPSTLAGQGPLYLANGVDPPQTWTGSGNLAAWTANATSNLPNGKYMVYTNDRVWVAGMSSYTPFGASAVADPGSTLAFSGIANPRDFPAINVATFDANDGDQITGLGTYGPYLLVFKRRKVFLVFDLDTGAHRRISDGTGCIAPRSIVETPQGTMFLALDRGVYRTKGDGVELMSDIIRPSLDAIPSALRANACAAFHNNHYYLSTSETSTSVSDVTYDFDLNLQSWWKHSFAATQFAVWRASTSQDLYSAPLASRVDKLMVPGVFTDNGSNYTAYWTGAWQSPAYFRRRIIQTPDYKKRIREVRLQGKGKFSLSVARDFAGSPTLAKTFDFTGTPTTFGGSGLYGGDYLYGDTPTITQGRAPTLGVANSFSLQWASDASNSGSWELENYILLLQERKD
ncbi:hypothetical protein NBH00_05185 [Paraconexibacter antarcticus]|uniref:Uncharacterized protein n=1 Tax=Paraconexibacter antarcticus TaxID=2949664 RepID=A0ABY5DYF6_9ACTN|nr:hypothetical protein [Paraconexibacter antarcticus]UTI65604.1 hypothetical protein NBH00_05185 [Paraconexibacter antarcticus]